MLSIKTMSGNVTSGLRSSNLKDKTYCCYTGLLKGALENNSMQ